MKTLVQEYLALSGGEGLCGDMWQQGAGLALQTAYLKGRGLASAKVILKAISKESGIWA